MSMDVGTGKAVSLLFGRGLIFPYDMMVKIDGYIADYLRIMSTKDKLKVIWLGVAPKHTPFSDLGLEEAEILGKKLLIAGYKEEILEVNTDSLKKILDEYNLSTCLANKTNARLIP